MNVSLPIVNARISLPFDVNSHFFNFLSYVLDVEEQQEEQSDDDQLDMGALSFHLCKAAEIVPWLTLTLDDLPRLRAAHQKAQFFLYRENQSGLGPHSYTLGPIQKDDNGRSFFDISIMPQWVCRIVAPEQKNLHR